MKAVNLLPRDGRHRPAGEAAGKSAYIVCGVLALVLAMVAAYVLTANNVTERKNEAAAAGAEADRLEAEIAAQANYTELRRHRGAAAFVSGRRGPDALRLGAADARGVLRDA